MSGHSVIPPSSAKVWGSPGGCPGWVSVNRDREETEPSEAALDGTACHAIGERMIRRALAACTGEDVKPFPEYLVGGVVEDRIVTAEMYKAAHDYAEFCIGLAHRAGVLRGGRIGVEKKLKAPSVHPLSEGTVDFFVVDFPSRALHVVDLKFGFGVVEEFENWQGINYAAAVLDNIEHADQISEINITIVQPRAYHPRGRVRTWTLDRAEFESYRIQLREGAELALSPAAFTRAGPHCRYCKGRHSCESAIRSGLELYEAVMEPSAGDMTPESMANLMDIVRAAIDRLGFVESGLSAEMEAKLRKGARIPGYELKPSAGKETWDKPIEEVIRLGELFGVDVSKPGAITPKQARDKGLDPALVTTYTKRKTSLKLTKSDDTEARRVFG